MISRRIAGVLAGGVLVVSATVVAADASARRGAAVPGRSALTASLRLRQRDVAPGATIRGELVLDDRGSTAKVLLRGCRIDGLFAIGLRASDGDLQAPAFSAVACGQESTLRAEPGITIDRFALPATYSHCVQSAGHQPPRGSRNWAPLCLRDPRGRRDIMPPLPAGRYTAVFFPDGMWRGPRVATARLRVR